MSGTEFEVALQEGVSFFDSCMFAEAYDVWTQRWELEAGEQADLLQGLLQIAAGMAKLQGADPIGATKLLSSGSTLLETFRPAVHGIDIDALVERVRECLTLAKDQAASMPRRGDKKRSNMKENLDEQSLQRRRPWWRRWLLW